MRQKTREEWIEWLEDFVTGEAVDDLLKNRVLNDVSEEVFYDVFIDSLARSLMKKAIEDGDLDRQGAYEMIRLLQHTRVAVMGALLVGFALGQEVQVGT